LAIAALALGASPEEIRISGILIGLCFTLLAFLRKEMLPIPETVVRAVQAGLGALLLKQGLLSGGALSVPTLLACLILTSALFLFGKKIRIPLLGIGALLAFSEAMITRRSPAMGMPLSVAGLRPGVLLSLILPQLALSTMNSVRGARLALEEYFGSQDAARTERKLLFSIGIGNLLAGLIHGLPFCHGAGGITAHFQAGARTHRMNLGLGSILLLLAYFAHRAGTIPTFHPLALTGLLGLIGLYHFELSRPVLKRGASGIVMIGGAGLLALLTGNLLYSLAFALVFEGALSFSRKGAAHA
jgi:uncharacterized membrane protein (UPF0136 family)